MSRPLLNNEESNRVCIPKLKTINLIIFLAIIIEDINAK